MTRRKLISIIIFELVLISIFFSSIFTYYQNGKNTARAYSNHIINEIKSDSSNSEINNNLLEKYFVKFTKNPWVDQKDVKNLEINISFFDIDYAKENYLKLGLNKELKINKDFFRNDKFLNIFKKYSVKFFLIENEAKNLNGIVKIESNNKTIFFKSFYKALLEFTLASLVSILIILFAWDKLVQIFRKWKAIIFSQSDDGIFIYFPILILTSLIIFIPSLIKNWYIYYGIIVLYIYFLPKINFSNLPFKRFLILSAFFFLLVLCFYEVFINFGYIGTRMNYPVIKRFQILIAAFISVYLILRNLGIEKRLLIYLVLLISFALIEFRAAENLYGIIGALSFIVFVYIINKYFFSIEKEFRYQQILNTLLSIGIVYCVYTLAFRTDWLFFAEQGFHASYYVAPMISLESGYNLLSDQPSQYGFLNILIPFLLNIENPLNSFHVFQSSLLVIVVLFSYLIFAKIMKIRNFSILLFIFSILLVLSDPMLIGPNAYPSCSVVRFFPVYLFILINTFLLNKKIQSNTFLILNATIIVFSLLWSAEAFYYTIFPLLFIFGTKILLDISNLKKIKVHLYDIFKLVSFSFILFLSFIIIYKYNLQIEDINLELLFIHTIGYGKGYAVMPIDPLTPLLIIIVPIIFVIHLAKNDRNIIIRYSFYSSIMLGLITYYVARAVPNNLNALWPLIFLIFTIATYDLKKFTNNKIILKFAIIPAILVSSLCLTNFSMNIIKQSDGYEGISGWKSSSFYTKSFNNKYNFELSDKHIEIQKKLEQISENKINLSILTAGRLNSNLIKSGNIKPFVQSPVMLLAKPLKDSQIREIVSKSKNFLSKDGYIVHDNKWDHFDTLLDEILRVKSCDIIKKDERFTIYNCKKIN